MEPSTSPSPETPPSPASLRIFPFRYLHSPITSLLEYSGLLRPQDSQAQPLSSNSSLVEVSEQRVASHGAGDGEVAIRIIGGGGEEAEEEEEEGGENGNESNEGENRESSDSGIQRYDIQVVARWAEQILPFSLLLLVVFIRQHLQGMIGRLP